MTDDRHARVSDVFQRAVAMSPGERGTFLEKTCGSDLELRREVESLLAFDAIPARLDHPVVDLDLRASVTSDSPLAHPEHIGRYTILGVLGEGGMGTVFRARQAHPQREVALKVLNATLMTPVLLRRFEFEAAVLGRLKHPGIAQIYEADIAEIAGRRVPYFAMELVDGQPLTAAAAEQKLTIRQRLELVVRVCDAVSFAHQKGIVHRDLKPANILVARAGGSQALPKVLDFGVARAVDSESAQTQITHAGQLVGTLAYMSPEQLSGDPAQVDTQSDVYALGVIAFELLAGRPPIDLSRRSAAGCLDMLRSTEPPRLGTLDARFRGDVETIVATALARDRRRRYASVAALASDIERFLRSEPILARRPTLAYQFRLFARRNRVLVAGAATAAAALTLGIAATTWQAVRAMRSEALATRLAANEVAARRAAEAAARKADEIRSFLQSMLVSASQSRGRGAGFTVREALDEAAERIETEFRDYPDIRLELQMTIGEGYKGLGLHREAQPHLRASLRAREAILGMDHPDLVEPLFKLAQVERGVGNFVECERLLSRALEMSIAHRGRDSDQARELLASLSAARRRLGRSAEAQRLLDESVAASQGDRGRDSVGALYRRAAARATAMDWSGAESLYREVLRRLPADGDESYALRTSAMNRLSRALHFQGRCNEAVPLMEIVLERQRHAVGERAARVPMTQANLAVCLAELGQWPEAMQLGEGVQAAIRKLEPEEPLATADLCRKLADLYRLVGDADRAETLLRQGITIAQAHERGLEWLHCCRVLATLLLASGREIEAEQLLAKAVADAEAGPLAEHELTHYCRQAWGNSLRRLGQYALAEAQLCRAYDGLSAVLGDDSPGTQSVIADLVSVYESQGDESAAAAFRARLRADGVGRDPPRDAADP